MSRSAEQQIMGAMVINGQRSGARRLGLLVLLTAALLSACAGMGRKDYRATPGVLLIYSEKEAGTEFYRSRMFVNPGYIIIKSDLSTEDFVLFDRQSRTIYSTNSDDKSVLVIKPREVNIKPPIEVSYKGESRPSAAIPKVAGNPATHYRYFVNGEHCYDVVTIASDLAKEVAQALTEFRQVMAGEHASTVHNTPKDMLDPCDLALNIFHPGDHLKQGMPLREWDRKGYVRFLVNYEPNFTLADERFELPKDYRHYSIGE